MFDYAVIIKCIGLVLFHFFIALLWLVHYLVAL